MKKHYVPLKLKVKRTSTEDVLTLSLEGTASPSMADGYFYTDWEDSTVTGE